MLQIKIDNKRYGRKKVLKAIQMDIASNGVYGIIGKNGAGKTTLLRCIAGETSYQGSIHMDEKSIPKTEIAWCPSEPYVYDYLTAKEFSTFFSILMKKKGSNKHSLFDLPQKKLIHTFSSGMKKKAYLNALLQKEYRLYLFDELFNGLDIESVFLIQKLIKELSKNHTVLISSHILSALFPICDRIFLIQKQTIQIVEKENFDGLEEKLF